MAEFESVANSAPPPARSLSGTTIGRFVVAERLGKGGMGEVYRAHDTKLKRTVAVKRLAPQLCADSVYRRRFLEEAGRVSRFSDPRIAAIYDVVEDGNEMFLIMEFVEGETLRLRLRRPLSLTEFLEIAIQCAGALAAAHDRGIVHCDVKPENIMLTPGGQVKVLDFGVAKNLPRSDQSSTIDRSGTMAGTPAYMSPEVLMERPPDGRADIFSLGIVFYEALTGHHPFMAGSFIATTDRIRNEKPAPVRIFNSKVPGPLEELVSKALAKDTDHRYQSAKDLLRDLTAIRAGLKNASAASDGGWRRLVLLARWKWKQTAVLFAALLLLFVLAVPQIRHWFTDVAIPGRSQVVVLPFAYSGMDPGAKAFSDGLSETLSAKLTQLTGSHPLQVVPLSEVRAQNISTVEQARREFGVNLVLEGSLHGAGNQVRVTYSLVDAVTKRQLHAGTVDADIADAFGMEDRVVDGVLKMLGLEVQGNERVVLASHGTGDPSAYDQYLRGRGYLLDYHKPENIDSAIAAFNRAITLDAKYAQAYAGLGEAYWHAYQEGQRGSEWMQKARAACEKAVSTGPDLADGYACLGRVYRETGLYETAAAQFQKATTLNPTSDDAYRGLADAYQKLNKPAEAEATYQQAIKLRPQYWAGYSWLGAFYYSQARYDDAVKMFKEVISLAPDNFRGYSNLGGIYVAQARYQDAIDTLQKSIALRPSSEAYDNLGTAYFSLRKYSDAAVVYEKSLEFDKNTWITWGNLGDAYFQLPGKHNEAMNSYREATRLADHALQVNPRDGYTLACRSVYVAMAGNKNEALTSLQKAISFSPRDPDVCFRAALVYNHFGDNNGTLEWLRKALEAGEPVSLVQATPDFDHLRDNPQFKAMLSQHQGIASK